MPNETERVELREDYGALPAGTQGVAVRVPGDSWERDEWRCTFDGGWAPVDLERRDLVFLDPAVAQ